MSEIHPSILNLEKTDYHNGDLFFGQPLGLLDTININFPELERLYKRVISLDWDVLIPLKSGQA